MAELSIPGPLGEIATAALEHAVEQGELQEIDVKRAFILVYSEEVEPNTGVAAVAEGEDAAVVYGHLFEMLCSTARQCAERAGIPFAIATIPTGGDN